MSTARVQLTRHIRQPAARVFAVLTDLSLMPAWDPRISRVTPMTRGPLRRGAIVRSFLNSQGREEHLDDEIVEFDPPTRFALRSVLGGTESVSYTLAEDDGGETRLDVDLTYEIPEAISGTENAADGLRRAIETAVGESLRLLQEIVERDAASPA